MSAPTRETVQLVGVDAFEDVNMFVDVFVCLLNALFVSTVSCVRCLANEP